MNRQMKRKSLLGCALAAILLLALAVQAFAALPGISDGGMLNPRDNAGMIDGTGDDAGGDGRVDSSPTSDGLLTEMPSPMPDTGTPRDSAGDTATPDSGTVLPDGMDTAVAGSSSEDGGFSWWGLVIALLIAAAVIALIVVLIPKKDQSDARR